MPIKINSTGGGSVSIDVPSTGGTYTLTAPANNATIFTTAGGAITGNVAFTSNNVSIGGQTIAPNLGMKNRIINGAMIVDQRNAGASLTPSNQAYTVDRWYAGLTQSSKFSVQQNAGSITPPAGFSNYLGVTSLSSYSTTTGDTFYVGQKIEGYNLSDLAYGTSSAKSLTLSFWVYSSLTGTFGGSLNNAANTRSYLFSYTISSSNTWTYITITIPGDAASSLAGTTNASLIVWFGLGSNTTYSSTAGSWLSGTYVQPTSTVSVVGTSGATFYITGVQLEVGPVATPFEFRQYGTELALCQRYFEILGRGMIGTSYSQFIGVGASYKVTKRATPTVTLLTSSPTFYMFAIGIVTGTSSTINVQGNDTSSIGVYFAGMPTQAVTGYFCTSTTDSLLSIAAEL